MVESKRRRGQQRMRWLDGIINSVGLILNKLGDSEGQGSLKHCSLWSRRVGHNFVTERQQRGPQLSEEGLSLSSISFPHSSSSSSPSSLSLSPTLFPSSVFFPPLLLAHQGGGWLCWRSKHSLCIDDHLQM